MESRRRPLRHGNIILYLGDTLQRDIDLVELDEIGLIYSLEEIEIVICLDGFILLESQTSSQLQ